MVEGALASRLKRRVVLQKLVLTPDGIGGFGESWQKFVSVWAEVSARNGVEAFQDERVVGSKKINLVMRYLSGVTTSMRVQFGARFFQIISIVNPYEENEMLEILAEEIN